ncbi:nucleotidyltransferase [Loigolactobacillus zhaoyuanensis]|uniref:tRNA(Met) cytidine acetate ligase n=1 Tax=Loigolactobacillus zhaoyuanensis TaxID=2486017 RepID=A0ABW8UDT7_9LACO|nr:nucleotidyltransferase [Loigolactobacillus zhaoyuanensis]
MQAVGIVVEYNPLHNGHLYHLAAARQRSGAKVVVAVMSGNFVQRGEPAILDKWTRTQAALDQGVDLVVELPFAAAVAPADRFATGALQLLTALQCKSLVFGTEDTSIDYQQVGRKLATLPNLHEYFRDYQQTYATQLNHFYQETLHLNIDSPNQLLGLSYATANAQLAQPMRLLPVARKNAQYLDQDLNGTAIASATAIRRLALGQSVAARSLATVVPPMIAHALQQQKLASWTDFYPYLRYRILSTPIAELGQIYQMTEGLEYRFHSAIKTAPDFPSLLRGLKTKRYTYTRLQRLCLYVLLNIHTPAIRQVEQQPYIHLLGFSQRGQEYLHQIKDQLDLPLIARVSQKIGQEQGLLGLEVRVDDVYAQINGHEQNFNRPPLRAK